ncbi:MAG: chemotaxis protein CheW [Desulfomonile sp.]
METFSNHFVIFKVDDQDYALSLLNVERVVRAVQITRLPSNDKYVLGVVDVQGEVVQVLNTRRILDSPDKEIDLSDQFVISKSANRKLILVADSVPGVYELSVQEARPLKTNSKSPGVVRYVARLGDSLVVVINIDLILSILDEANPSIPPPFPN